MVKTKPIPELSKKATINFWNKVNVAENQNDCWEWVAHKDSCGYGRVQLKKGGLFSAHRVAYFLVNKVDPADFHVLHNCDNPACCNPSHFFLGTQVDNMRDREKKGRANHPSGDRHGTKTKPHSVAKGERNGHYTKPECTLRGEKSGTAKLTQNQVLEIIHLISKGDNYSSIAKQYGVTSTTIQYISKGKSWKHLMANTQNVKRVGGSDNWNTNLKDEDILLIRKMYKTGEYSYSDLMKLFSIGKNATAFIIRGKTWKHLLPQTA